MEEIKEVQNVQILQPQQQIDREPQQVQPQQPPQYSYHQEALKLDPLEEARIRQEVRDKEKMRELIRAEEREKIAQENPLNMINSLPSQPKLQKIKVKDYKDISDRPSHVTWKSLSNRKKKNQYELDAILDGKPIHYRDEEETIERIAYLKKELGIID
jgi:hypothetical protein